MYNMGPLCGVMPLGPPPELTKSSCPLSKDGSGLSFVVSPVTNFDAQSSVPTLQASFPILAQSCSLHVPRKDVSLLNEFIFVQPYPTSIPKEDTLLTGLLELGSLRVMDKLVACNR